MILILMKSNLSICSALEACNFLWGPEHSGLRPLPVVPDIQVMPLPEGWLSHKPWGRERLAPLSLLKGKSSERFPDPTASPTQEMHVDMDCLAPALGLQTSLPPTATPITPSSTGMSVATLEVGLLGFLGEETTLFAQSLNPSICSPSPTSTIRVKEASSLGKECPPWGKDRQVASHPHLQQTHLCPGQIPGPGSQSAWAPITKYQRVSDLNSRHLLLKRHVFDPWVSKMPWRREWQPISVFLLDNSVDRGAWWTIVHGVAKSQTRLSTQPFFCAVLC